MGGTAIGDFTLSTTMEDYTFETNAGGDVKVVYDNDAGNADVQIDYAVINGVTLQAEDQPDNTGVWNSGQCGGIASEWLQCSGHIGFGFLSPGEPGESTGTGLFTHADFPIGMAVSGPGENRSFLDIAEKQVSINEHFGELTAGNIMKMSYLHPAEDRYNWDNAEQMLNWANANGKKVHGHTFIWHSDYQIPNWMKNYSGDFEAMLDEHVRTIATRFKGRVVSWDVANEVINEANNCWRDSVFYQKLGKDFVANAFRVANEADPDVDLYYNDFDTEGGNTAKLSCLLELVDELQAANVPIDGVGFQMHVQIDWPSTSAIASAFQAIVDRGLKVKITELDIPLNNPWASAPFPQYTAFTDAAAERQKQRYKSIVQTYLDTVPAHLRGGITVWGLWDGDSWLLELGSRQGTADWPLLFSGPANGPYEAKPALDGFIEALDGQ
ncbi:Endo-1,4-beta-xylanase, GH35 family [Alteromonadaceae bacterium Bs31]|nr:Endo-1,4-beta-xylanase, GH35 family [Alteromonadaceae bacterium Bs31]